MKQMITFGISMALLSSTTFAIPPVILSGPTPAVTLTRGAGIPQTVVYTITNNVPNQSFPLAVRGIFGPVTRTSVANDCGFSIPKGPSTCNIGIRINPTVAEIGLLMNQTLQVFYQGRIPLTSTIAFISRQAFLYVTNNSNNTVSQCSVNLETGVISSCIPFSDPTFRAPSGITVNSLGTFSYVSNFDNNTISECPIQASGLLGPCTASQASATLNGPAGLTINSSNSLLYITNFSNNTLSICSIGSAGLLGSCTASIPGPLNNPDDIHLDPRGVFAYITNTNLNTVSQCLIAGNGTLTDCISSNSVFNHPSGITISQSGTNAYVNNSQFNGGSVSVCPLLSNGSLGQCTTSNPNGTFNISFGKNAINAAGTFLFVANSANQSDTVSVCNLASNGNLIACSASNPNSTFFTPQGLALN